MRNAYKYLQAKFGSRMKVGEPLARYTTFKVGGPADLYFEASTYEDLLDVLSEATSAGMPFMVFGGGSNILVGDKGIRGLVVRNMTGRIHLAGITGSQTGGNKKKTVYVEVDSGVIVNKLVRFTIEEGLGGLEMHLGLPGTVGGALYMNSKWTKPEAYMGDAVYQATMFVKGGEVRTVPKSYFRFAYDSSTLQKTKEWVLRVVFALTPRSKDALWEVANGSIAYRRESQPQGVFSAGCTFRNISKADALRIGTPNLTTSAGFLVDHAGLKGLNVGEAQISPIHANFIINKGKASAADVVQLIDRAKEQVKRQFGVVLEEEIVRVGEF